MTTRRTESIEWTEWPVLIWRLITTELCLPPEWHRQLNCQTLNQHCMLDVSTHTHTRSLARTHDLTSARAKYWKSNKLKLNLPDGDSVWCMCVTVNWRFVANKQNSYCISRVTCEWHLIHSCSLSLIHINRLTHNNLPTHKFTKDIARPCVCTCVYTDHKLHDTQEPERTQRNEPYTRIHERRTSSSLAKQNRCTTNEMFYYICSWVWAVKFNYLSFLRRKSTFSSLKIFIFFFSRSFFVVQSISVVNRKRKPKTKTFFFYQNSQSIALTWSEYFRVFHVSSSSCRRRVSKQFWMWWNGEVKTKTFAVRKMKRKLWIVSLSKDHERKKWQMNAMKRQQNWMFVAASTKRCSYKSIAAE